VFRSRTPPSQICNSLLEKKMLVGAAGIEIASLVYKSHRTKALPTALGFNCCQMLPTKGDALPYRRNRVETCPFKWATLPYRAKRTLCSDSSIIPVDGRQAPKEPRRALLLVFSYELCHPRQQIPRLRFLYQIEMDRFWRLIEFAFGDG
jgi:hypothetical protein